MSRSARASSEFVHGTEEMTRARMHRVVVALLTADTLAAAAEELGVTKTWLASCLRRPEVVSYMDQVRRGMMKAVVGKVVVRADAALDRLHALMVTTQNEKLKFRIGMYLIEKAYSMSQAADVQAQLDFVKGQLQEVHPEVAAKVLASLPAPRFSQAGRRDGEAILAEVAECGEDGYGEVSSRRRLPK